MSYYLFDSCKALWHMDRIIEHYDKGKPITPLHIDIGMTKLCNALCKYCYGIKQNMTGEIIPEKPLVRLFKDAPQLGVKSISITGDGEPTLNPAMYKALKTGKRYGLDIGLATNGVILKDMVTILESCVWCRFNLSAGTRKGYAHVHGKDYWNEVTENVFKIMELKNKIRSKCTIGLQMVLIPECLDEVLPETKFALRAGVDYLVIKQFSDPGNKKMSQFNQAWYDDKHTLEVLAEAQAKSTAQTKVIPKWNTIKNKGKRNYDRCVDCALLFQISGNSKCYPCGYLFGNEKYCYGDLKKQNLEDILTSDKYWNIIRYMREKFDVHTKCEGACRHDAINKFLWDYLHPPQHKNFI